MSEPRLEFVRGGRLPPPGVTGNVDGEATQDVNRRASRAERWAWRAFTGAVALLFVLLCAGYVFWRMDEADGGFPVGQGPGDRWP